MLVAGFETSTPQLGVALVRDEDPIGEYTLGEGLRHCERLLLALDGLLGDLGITARDLDGVAVATGPGSFTGLRIGVAAAQGLAFAAGAPAVGVSSLAALVEDAAPWQGSVLGCLDARRGEVYFSAWSLAPGRSERLLDDSVAPPERVAERLPFATGEPVLVVGNGAELVVPELSARGYHALPGTGVANLPRAVRVAMLGARALRHGRGGAPDGIQPQYLRRTDAERVRDRTGVAPDG